MLVAKQSARLSKVPRDKLHDASHITMVFFATPQCKLFAFSCVYSFTVLATHGLTRCCSWFTPCTLRWKGRYDYKQVQLYLRMRGDEMECISAYLKIVYKKGVGNKRAITFLF